MELKRSPPRSLNAFLTPRTEEVEEVSTELTPALPYCNTQITSSARNKKRDFDLENVPVTATKRVCDGCNKPSEKPSWGCSTTLYLYEDPWKIKKTLNNSDLGHLSRLLLATSLVKDLVLPVLGADARADVEAERGVPVEFWDVDTNSLHRLILKRWSSSKCYVFIENWNKDFVKRRGLKRGDEIGLHWDPYNTRFDFSVLKRACQR